MFGEVKETCPHCGGMGKDLRGRPCSCELGKLLVEDEEEFKSNRIENLIPELFRNQEDKVGHNQIVQNTNGETVQDFLSKLAKWMVDEEAPSLFLDTSNTELGAYEVYYALLEKLHQEARKRGEELSQDVINTLYVNKLEEDRFDFVNQNIPLDTKSLNTIIISDFPTDRYNYLTYFVKLLDFDRQALFVVYGENKPNWSTYPLHMYCYKFVQ